MNKIGSMINSNTQFTKSILIDSIQILCLYFLTVIVIYGLPRIAGYVLFLIIIAQFYKSKKDYFWLAFFFIIITGPGGFFYITESVSIGQIPNFRFFGTVNISITELFLAIAIIKAFVKGKKQAIPLSKPITLILFYSLLLFFLSMVIFDASLIRVLKDLRYFFYYFSLIPLVYLIYRRGEGEKFIYCLFPFVFISFFTSIYFIIKGDYFIHLFAPGVMRHLILGIEEGGMRFSTSGGGEHLVLLLCYIFSLFMIFKDTRLKGRNIYLILIAAISYFTMILTATRMWFVVFSFIFVMSTIFIKKNIKVVIGILLILPILYIPFRSVSKIHDFTRKSWTRIESVFEVGEAGSISYEAMQYKKEFRLIPILKGIKRSPFIGFGISNQFYKYTKGGDIGNFNLILRAGIIGFLLFVNLWVCFFKIVHNINKKISYRNPYNNLIFFFNITLLGMLIPHFITHQMFYIVTTQAYSTFMMIFIFIFGYFIKDALKIEISLKKVNQK